MAENNNSGNFSFDEIKFQRIKSSDDFADKVMGRIRQDESGGLTAMSSIMKAMVISAVLLIYGSTGILIGVQSYRLAAQKTGSFNKNETFIREFAESHHLQAKSGIDKLIISF